MYRLTLSISTLMKALAERAVYYNFNLIVWVLVFRK